MPGSLNLVKEAGQTKKEIKSIYDLLHRLQTIQYNRSLVTPFEPGADCWGPDLKTYKKMSMTSSTIPNNLYLDKDTLK